MNYLFVLTRLTILACTCMSVGCGAEFNSIFRTFKTENQSVLIDAKQRVIAVSALKDKKSEYVRSHLCAEPSPDALSALSAAVTASGSYKEVGAQIAASISEVASNIGVRTQTIQLLRDAMYRLCEAHMNGALDAKEFQAQHRRYQIMMSGLMAIEALTGVVTPKQVVLRGESLATTGRNLIEAERNLKEAKDNLKIAEDQEAAATSSLNAAKKVQKDFEDRYPEPRNDEQKNKELKELQAATAAAQSSVEHKTEAKNSKKKVVEEMQALFEASKSLSAQSSTSGTVATNSCSPKCSTFSEANHEQVIEAVKSIVQGMFNPDVIYECMEFYTENGTVEKAKKEAGPQNFETSRPSLSALDKFCQAKFKMGEQTVMKNLERAVKEGK